VPERTITPAITEPSRQTPVYGEFDVVVVSGGPAGIMAVAAAARAGQTTLLLERYGFLGGAGTAGGLSTFCGLHARTHGEDIRVIRGLADELLDRLVKLDGLNEPHLTIADGIAAQAFDISAYKIAADELVAGSGARILFHTMAVGAVMKNDHTIDAVIIESKSGRQAVRGRFFIDASGDGDLAAWAGVRYEKSREDMLYPSLMFRINGVDVARAGEKPWRTVERLMDGAEKRRVHVHQRPYSGLRGLLHHGHRAADRYPRDPPDRRRLPAHRGRRARLRRLPRHDRRQRLAYRGTRGRNGRVPLAETGAGV
jgi:hypothetical protein